MALQAWFYPGDSTGQEFVYPKSQAEELSRLNRREVPSSGSNEGYTAKSEERSSEAVTPQPKTENTTPEPAPAPSTAQTQPEPTPAPTPAPAVNPNPAPRSTEAAPQSNPAQAARPLPQTASLLPLVGLVSFTLLGAALILRLALRS